MDQEQLRKLLLDAFRADELLPPDVLDLLDALTAPVAPASPAPTAPTAPSSSP